jgi:ATP synthase F1 gamma subunit
MSKIVMIKRRIAVVRTISKTAQALSKTSFAWLGRAQLAVKHAQHFMNALKAPEPGFSPEQEMRLIVLWGPQRGFCGSYGNMLLTQAHRYAKKYPLARWIPIGPLARIFVAQHNLRTPDNIQAIIAIHRLTPKNYTDFHTQLLNAIKQAQQQNYTVHILYMHAQNVLASQPRLECIPIEIPLTSSFSAIPREQELSTISSAFSSLYIKGVINYVRAQALYSEHAARAIAMQSAHTNAQETLDKLALAYHKARQAKITNDIIELASGIDANQTS